MSSNHWLLMHELSRKTQVQGVALKCLKTAGVVKPRNEMVEIVDRAGLANKETAFVVAGAVDDTVVYAQERWRNCLFDGNVELGQEGRPNFDVR
jgi:hypothetical protein